MTIPMVLTGKKMNFHLYSCDKILGVSIRYHIVGKSCDGWNIFQN
jgi:hypothetical protein